MVGLTCEIDDALASQMLMWSKQASSIDSEWGTATKRGWCFTGIEHIVMDATCLHCVLATKMVRATLHLASLTAWNLYIEK